MSIPALAPTWVPVCGYDVLLPERGVAVLVDGEQIALFRLADGTVRAVGNRDPFSGAYVLSRGIVGSRGDVPTVASPMRRVARPLGMLPNDAWNFWAARAKS